ncbi:MAG: peptide deformylase [Lachnospiraceae bacterium]|nr:peptide deformylase [Lachnospiraceae bacterium]
MEKEICRDPILLAGKSTPAGKEDIPVADDLTDTLKKNADRCVGMAANMIGVRKRIIVFVENAPDGDTPRGGKTAVPVYTEMFNPEILSAKEPYETEEGCLSLDGVRKTKRFRTVKVRWQTRDGQTRIKSFSGFPAQIVQHEIDHLNGVLI